jgi:hypothetical protein
MERGGIGRKKDRNLTDDPRASFCVNEGFRYVTLEGTIEMFDDQATAQAEIAAPARRDHVVSLTEKMAWDEFAREGRVSLLVHVNHVDGREFDGEE